MTDTPANRRHNPPTAPAWSATATLGVTVNPLAERPDIRRRVYIAFWGLGLTLGAAQTGYAAAQAGQPVWLNVALSVYAFLGAGIGYTAQANTPGYTGEHEA